MNKKKRDRFTKGVVITLLVAVLLSIFAQALMLLF